MSSIKKQYVELLKRNYHLLKLYYSITTTAKFLFYRKDPVLILTIGKTGSSSVLFSLKKALSDRQVIQLHRYSDKSIEEANLFYKTGSFLNCVGRS